MLGGLAQTVPIAAQHPASRKVTEPAMPDTPTTGSQGRLPCKRYSQNGKDAVSRAKIIFLKRSQRSVMPWRA
jgi:hypothetical protein